MTSVSFPLLDILFNETLFPEIFSLDGPPQTFWCSFVLKEQSKKFQLQLAKKAHVQITELNLKCYHCNVIVPLVIWNDGFCGGRKTEEHGKKPSEQRQESTINL